MTFTAGDLDEYVSENDGWHDLSNEVQWGPKSYEVPGFGTATYVDILGAGEGDRELIFKIDDRLFSKSGYYSSYDGNEWDGDLTEVEAYEYTAVGYRAVR